ncbi:MAG: hypothetical protein IMZ46_02215 [Acidobacteria bacterium]|nr:hypothetical protein [Acidobacteriota bacterium]
MIGYFVDIVEANDYFALERLETACWDDLGSGSGVPFKDKVLLQAFNRLMSDPRWKLPLYANATAAEILKLRMGQAEEAYYLACHLPDEDRRKGLQAQGVIEAGVVKEKYDIGRLDDLPVPAIVQAILYPWLIDYAEFGVADIGRDEERSVHHKVRGHY